MKTFVEQKSPSGQAAVASVSVLLTFAAAAAADEPASGLRGFNPEKPERSRNRFSLSYRAGFNITADFKNLGFRPTPLDLPAGRTYDDGFVLLETSGTAAGSPDGFTSLWHYDNPGQSVAKEGGGGSLFMHKASSTSLGNSLGNDGDPQHGFELTFNRELGTVGRCFWGLEAAVGLMDLEIRDHRPVATAGEVITDEYNVDNLYQFGATGPTFPGPSQPGRAPASQIIAVNPDPLVPRSVAPFTGNLTGRRSLDAQIAGFRLGPYLEYPITERFNLSLSGGLALALIHSDFSFRESLELPGAGTLSNAGSSSHSDLVFGAYASGTISYALNHSWGVFTGAQYQYLGHYSHTLKGKEARLDLTAPVFVTLGVGYSF